MSRSRRRGNSNESPLDALRERVPINHSHGKVFYQVLAPADPLLGDAHATLKQCLKLLDLKAIVNSQNKEGRNFGQFRTIVLCAADEEILGAACVKCHKTEACSMMEVLAFGISPADRKRGYGALLASALKQTSKKLDLECIVCVFFDASASRFWEAMEFSQESLSAVEQDISNKSFIQYPGTSKMKFTIAGKADYVKEAKSKSNRIANEKSAANEKQSGKKGGKSEKQSGKSHKQSGKSEKQGAKAEKGRKSEKHVGKTEKAGKSVKSGQDGQGGKGQPNNIDSVVATIQELMDVQRLVFKQQLREMHCIRERQSSSGSGSGSGRGSSSGKKRKQRD